MDARSPLLSCLALASTPAEDGFLTAADVLRMHVPADLVVLSACRTGEGTVVRGEGVVGLVRSFFQAGASRVVASLWNGDDEATLLLMTRFHKALASGAPPPRALAEAQAVVRATPRWAHPYFWAGWVIWGLPD
jgi:CHAT domain-containing protein